MSLAEFEARADEADKRIAALAQKVASMQSQQGGASAGASDASALEDFKNLLLPQLIEMRKVVVDEQAQAAKLKEDNAKLEAENTKLEYKVQHLLKQLEQGEKGGKKKVGGLIGGAAGLGPAYTRGEIEAPAGQKDMGTWKAAVYTAEQQARLGVDEQGKKVQQKKGGKKDKKKKGGEQQQGGKKNKKGKKGKGGPTPEEAEKIRKSMHKKCFKEGGKKGQDIAGMAAFGQMFATAEMMEPAGSLEWLKVCMEGANVVVDESAEDRKGGSGEVGKFIYTYSEEQIAIMFHVPEALQSQLSIEEWCGFVTKKIGCGEIVEKTKDIWCVLLKKDVDKGHFPIKLRDQGIGAAYECLQQKKLVPEEEDDDLDLGAMAEANDVSWGGADY